MVLKVLALICLAAGPVLCAATSDKSFGPYQSGIGNIEFIVIKSSYGPQLFLEMRLIRDKLPPKVLYRTQTNAVQYIAPLMPDSSRFVVVWNDGPAYETVILGIRGPGLVVKMLDAIGMDYPEMIRLGTEDTQFVVLQNSGAKANVLDVADIYAFDGNTYKRLQTAPYDQKLAALTRLVEKIDRDAAERRKGVVVHP